MIDVIFENIPEIWPLLIPIGLVFALFAFVVSVYTGYVAPVDFKSDRHKKIFCLALVGVGLVIGALAVLYKVAIAS